MTAEVPFTAAGSVETVLARNSPAAAPRLTAVVGSLVRHLHDFVKEVGLTEEEWAAALTFLVRAGQISGPERDELILLSDVLGVSMLVDVLGHQRPAGATLSTVLGPFHVAGAPLREMGDSISLDGRGETCLFAGRVLGLEGSPIEGACLDVWSDNADGYYDVQQPDLQPRWNNRGRFVTGVDGRYSFRGIKPVSYPIPDDGPVGDLLTRLGRHPFRPAHLHLVVTAPGHQRLVTHTFAAGDPYLDSDAVFAVRSSLVATYEPGRDGSTTWHCDFDFILAPDGP